MSSSSDLHPQQEAIIKDLGVTTSFNAKDEATTRVRFLADYMKANRLMTCVLGISGGVDSSVCGRIAQLAVTTLREAGHKEAKFIAIRLPYGVQRDEDDAQNALRFIQPDEILTINVKPSADAALEAVKASGHVFRDEKQQDFIHGNIKARQRMVVQYAVAGAHNGLVIGTDHAAEAVMGFFTKYGDGGVDIEPLSGLTKRRVRAVGSHLGAPDSLVQKVPTADLESLAPGKTDEDAFGGGLTYEIIDDFLEGKPVSKEAASKIVYTYTVTTHKRNMPANPHAH
eukprot:TRINITY_DN2464_c0_g2_i3.p1 TRINITY_DN2464_c0_g2~~TRINITY_DN2464_c0_g2_i3.p1  ORF type:complete len:305 (+),score=66.71 TRINITY_DN2464_c0_g2_i3:65-916(+)